jgi:hypothetical protein
MLLGVVTARNLPQFGIKLLLILKMFPTLQLLISMPPLMKLKDLKSKDILLLNSTEQVKKLPQLILMEKEELKILRLG